MECEELTMRMRTAYIKKTFDQSIFFWNATVTPRLFYWNIEDLLKYRFAEMVHVRKHSEIYGMIKLIEILWFQEWMKFGIDESIGAKWIEYLFHAFSGTWFHPGTDIDMMYCELGEIFAQHFAQAVIRHWFAEWMRVSFSRVWDLVGPLWVRFLSEAIKLRWFASWIRLNLNKAQMWNAGLITLAKAIWKVWFKKWVCISLAENDIGHVWFGAICEVIRIVWFEEDVELYFDDNNIGSKWAQALLDVIKEKKLKKWVKISLIGSKIPLNIQAELNQESIKQWFNPADIFVFKRNFSRRQS